MLARRELHPGARACGHGIEAGVAVFTNIVALTSRCVAVFGLTASLSTWLSSTGRAATAPEM